MCSQLGLIINIFSAKPLPFGIARATSVQYKDTFIFVGGETLSNTSDLIFRYEQETENWKILDTRDVCRLICHIIVL